MAQELVLIPKSKYEHLLSKSNDSENMQNSQQLSVKDNEQNSQQSSVKDNNVKLQQHGGQLSNVMKKELFVKRNNNIFEQKYQ